jgi:chemotaxis protein MotB
MGHSRSRLIDDDQPTFRGARSRSVAGPLAVLLFAIAGALIYFGSQLWVQHDATQGALDQAKGELADLQRQSSARGGRLVALERQHTERDTQLAQANAKMLELNTALAAAQTRLDELDQERSAIREQLEEFQQLTRQFQRMIDSGRLEVSFRRGRMIVELPAQVLFPSGSAELTDEGGKALNEVARILRTMRDRRYIFAGHTDNVPVATERFASNWELSSARAVKVTAELIRGGLRPEQLVAAGYSEYDPVARNTNEAGKQKNRRIEIILEPRLMPLPGLAPAKAVAKAEEKAPEKAAEKAD